MTENENVCPACRELMQPTRFRPVRAQQSAGPVRQIPEAYDCPNRCQRTLSPPEWNAAVEQFQAEQRGEG